MTVRSNSKHVIKRDFFKNWQLYLMFVPVAVYYLMFLYVPMIGNILAFKEFVPGIGLKGFFAGKWVGLEYFVTFFSGIYAKRTIRNTLLLNIYNLVFSFPMPILLALALSEIPFVKFKRFVQTVTYMPHFVSTVVICGLVVNFSLTNGLFNQIGALLGRDRTPFMQYPQFFRTIYVATGIWQGVGWSSIIYLSAIASIDTQLYEAASIDGASRFRQVWHVTLPGISSTIIILFILQIGSMMSVGSEKILLLYNPSIYETSDVISTYVYRKGLVEQNFSFSSAVGMFNNIINFILLMTANAVSRKVSEVSLL